MRITRSTGIRFVSVATFCSACMLWLAPAEARSYGRDDEIKLTGCLIRAENGAGYLLTNAPDDPALFKADDRKVAPSAVGTTGGFATVFYWLYGNNDLTSTSDTASRWKAICRAMCAREKSRSIAKITGPRSR